MKVYQFINIMCVYIMRCGVIIEILVKITITRTVDKNSNFSLK